MAADEDNKEQVLKECEQAEEIMKDKQNQVKRKNYQITSIVNFILFGDGHVCIIKILLSFILGHTEWHGKSFILLDISFIFVRWYQGSVFNLALNFPVTQIKTISEYAT